MGPVFRDIAAATPVEIGSRVQLNTEQAAPPAADVGHPAPAARHRRHVAPAVAVAVALVAGLAIGRFLFLDQRPASTAPAPAVAVAADDRIRTLERELEVDPGDLRSWQALGVAYVQHAIETGDPAFYRLSDQAFDRADELRPADPETLVGRGVLALSLHDFAEARTLGLEAHAARPVDADALGVLVDAEVELGNYDAAADRLQQMVDVRPDLASLSRVSYLRELHGDIDGAIETMQQAATAGTPIPFDQATVTALAGDLHLLAGNLHVAAERYAAALEIAPGHPAAGIGQARLDVARGDVDAAVTALTELTSTQPRPDALILLSELQHLEGDAQAAAATDAVVRATALLQENAGQSVDLEMALFEADRGESPDRALELAERAYEERPDNVYAADALAWATHAAGDTENAVPLVEDALRLGTADPLLRFHAARIFADAGRPDRARIELERVAAVSPWRAIGVIDEVRALARELDVDLPTPWKQA